jgi:guanylate kinase
MKRPGKLFLISGPSGVGKTTLVDMVLGGVVIDNLSRVITYTTKAPRETEKSGIDYHFLTEDDFCRRIKEGFFLEWSKAYNNYYGSPYELLAGLDDGCSYIMIVDRNGADRIKKMVPQAVSICILPPDIATLQSRLIKRNTESQEVIRFRMATGLQEMDSDHTEKIFDHYLINDSLSQSLKLFCSIINKELQK